VGGAPSFDVAIAGGGIAGASLAVMLGRAGLSVALYEQRAFPSEKPCGEGLMPAGVGVLERLGLSDPIGGFPFVGIRYRAGDVLVEGRFPRTIGVPPCGLGQRRLRLDHALFQAAVSTPGVRATQGVRVEGPLVEAGRVVGLRAGGSDVRARLVVAADGPLSPLRRALGLDGVRARRQRMGVRAHFRLAPGQVAPDHVEIFLGAGHELYVTPLPDGEVLIAGLADSAAVLGQARTAYARWIDAQPILRARLEGAAALTDVEGRAPLASRARAGFVPGAVLLGDAAGFIDPVTGGGMAQALLAAELLAAHAPHMLAPGPSGDAWLRRFDARRNALLRSYRALTHVVLWLAGSPRRARFALRTLRATPWLFRHLIGVAGGTRRLV